MNTIQLPRKQPGDISAVQKDPVDSEILEDVREILTDVEKEGKEAVRRHAVRLGDMEEGEDLIRDHEEMRDAYGELPAVQRDALETTAHQIREFAEAQRNCIDELEIAVKGGRAGHDLSPVKTAGCYAPGGRYPLPSTVLMSVITARKVGVENVWVASPGAEKSVLAAAHVSEADGLIAAGGVQGLGGLASGAGEVPPADVVVGPGNRWVTAAKYLLSGRVRIEFLAGPTELVVLAGTGVSADRVAADLLAQAEHAPDALPVLIAPSDDVIARVESSLSQQLKDLPTAEVARDALQNGYAVEVSSVEEGIEISDRIAPEHLHVCGFENSNEVADRVNHYGALFVGSESAEVFGDYGIGPNHVLPTGGTARSTGGLSVLNFLRMRTWLDLKNPGLDRELIRNIAILARMEGLEAHARSAEKRLRDM